MNNTRRKRLSDILERLEVIKSDLEEITEEERDAFYNMPDSLQESERGQTMEEGLDTLDDALGTIEDICDNITEII